MFLTDTISLSSFNSGVVYEIFSTHKSNDNSPEGNGESIGS